MEESTNDLFSLMFSNRTKKINTTISNLTIVQNKYFRITFAILFSFMTLMTFCGGLFVCHVVRKHKLWKSTVWMLLIFLTISDTLNGVITIPTYIAAYIDESILHDRWMCNFSTFVSIFFAHTTIYAIAAISVGRMKVVLDPYSSLDAPQLRTLTGYVLFAVLLSASLSVPPILGFGEYNCDRGKSWCTFRGEFPDVKQQNKYMIFLICLFGYLVPLLVIIWSSVKTYLAFRTTSTVRLAMRGRSVDEICVENWRMARVMMIVIIAFLIFWTPIVIYLFTISLDFRPGGWFWPIWGHIAHLVMFLQGIINPFVFTCKHRCFNKEIRCFYGVCSKMKNKVGIQEFPTKTP